MLSKKQKEIHMKMNSVNNLEKRQQLRHERNHILTEIHDLIRVEETNKVDAVTRPSPVFRVISHSGIGYAL